MMRMLHQVGSRFRKPGGDLCGRGSSSREPAGSAVHSTACHPEIPAVLAESPEEERNLEQHLGSAP